MRRQMERLVMALFSALLLAVALMYAYSASAGGIIDGDTIELEGETIRLHGVDAFERDQTCRTADGR